MTDDAYANASDARDGTIELVSAYVSNTNTRLSGEELQALIRDTFATLSSLSSGATSAALPAEEPEMTKKTRSEIKKSITDENLISFEDGRPYKSLKRHLTTRGLSPADYREKYGLPSDYPMTHPAYSARRSELAKSIGLGSKGRVAKVTAPTKGRKPKASAAE